MLHVLFRAGGERYAIRASVVREIAPLVETRSVPHAPAFVAGICNYRGQAAPVLDLARILGQGGSRSALSTRIIFVDFPLGDGQTRPLGLIAEGVTRTADFSSADRGTPGVRPPDAPYLGEIFMHGSTMIQRVEVADLLPESVQLMLFTDGEDDAG